MNELSAEDNARSVYTHNSTQVVRLIDVAFIGPVCIYAGVVKSGLPTFVRISILVIGIATIGYNLANFVWAEKMIMQTKEKENAKVSKA